MKELYTASTDAFVDFREQKRVEARIKAEAAAKNEAEETRYRDFINQRNAMRRKEVAAVFRKGAQRGKTELMTGMQTLVNIGID